MNSHKEHLPIVPQPAGAGNTTTTTKIRRKPRPVDFPTGMERYVQALRSCPLTTQEDCDGSGEALYTLYERGVPQYVGETDDLKRRIEEHSSEDADSATFIIKIMRQQHGFSLKRAELKARHSDDYKKCQQRVANMMIRYAYVPFGKTNRLGAELYCQMSLRPVCKAEF